MVHLMALDALVGGPWEVFNKNWKVLTAESGGEVSRELCQDIWNHWEDVCSYVRWRKMGSQSVWVTNDDDKRWFLYNLLIGGSLTIMVQGPAPDNEWKSWSWSSQKRSYDLVESKVLPQNNARKKTQCGNTRVRLLENEVVPIKGF